MQREPHKAAPGVQADERREHTPKPCEIQRLRPWEPESKIELRRKLNQLALLAQSRAQRTDSPDARSLLWLIALVAGRWVLASADEATLQDMREGLIRAGLAANAFERNGSGL